MSYSEQPSPKELTRAPGAVAARGALVLLAASSLVALGHFDFSLCPFANLTGHPCPGCGLTRAAVSLLSGDFRAAIGFHPLSPLIIPLAALLVGPSMWRFVVGDDRPAPPPARKRWPEVLFAAVAAALLVVWGSRFFGFFGGPVEVHPLWGASVSPLGNG